VSSGIVQIELKEFEKKTITGGKRERGREREKPKGLACKKKVMRNRWGKTPSKCEQ